MDRITEYCTGCRACEQLCAHHAIEMKPDKEGFLSVYIDRDKCVDCGLCQNRCPQNALMQKSEPLMSLAVRDRDDKELVVSASGGAFAAAASGGAGRDSADPGQTVYPLYRDTVSCGIHQLLYRTVCLLLCGAGVFLL